MKRWFSNLWKCLTLICILGSTLFDAQAQPQEVKPRQTLTIAAFPAVDEIVKSAIPLWKHLHPDVEIKVVSR